MTQWYFHPGFTSRTGGLLRETEYIGRQAVFRRDAWLEPRAFAAPRREPPVCSVSLFSYFIPEPAAWLARGSRTPTDLLLASGQSADAAERVLGPGLRHGALQAFKLPRLSQHDYDHLLWSCDLNFVRGEDSFVRAQLAGRPFVWQPYVQTDAAHVAKLDAFLERFLGGAPAALSRPVRSVFAAWNGLVREPEWPDPHAWARHCAAWREALLQQDDLTTQLIAFASARC
jgi:uncharacterized repeat protein (TIGR03837 family)